jgi:hypothetical protein
MNIDDDAKCVNELETLAYKLEAKYLDEVNEQHHITESQVQKVSACK